VGVVLIQPFAVAAGEDERFLADWGGMREALAQRPGHLGTRLHRSVAAADFRFVHLARWSSPLAFARAGKHVATALPFPSHAALYLAIR
jgi:heme-degrading monooxygenase HmoA